MKSSALIILLLLTFAPASAQRPDPAAPPDPAKQRDPRPLPREPRPDPAPPAAPAEDFALERRAAADPSVVVSLCLASGDVVVRGWERNEVRARAAEVGALVLQTDSAQPARRVEVLVSEGEEARVRPGECGLTSGLELNVPRGASVNLRIHEGDVAVSDVAELTVNDMSGDVEVRGVSRSAEVMTMSGDVSFSDSKGRARLRAVSGSIQASNALPLADGDTFEAASTSGDVELDDVRHARVTGSTISGNVRMTGALARGGTYEFKSISGDVTLALPADSSFRLNAKVVLSGEIVTDFPVRAANITSAEDDPPTPAPVPAPASPPGRQRPGRVPAPPPPSHPRPTRLVGTVGAGDAAVDLSSFSGTLHLKRQ